MTTIASVGAIDLMVQQIQQRARHLIVPVRDLSTVLDEIIETHLVRLRARFGAAADDVLDHAHLRRQVDEVRGYGIAPGDTLVLRLVSNVPLEGNRFHLEEELVSEVVLDFT